MSDTTDVRPVSSHALMDILDALDKDEAVAQPEHDDEELWASVMNFEADKTTKDGGSSAASSELPSVPSSGVPQAKAAAEKTCFGRCEMAAA